MTKGVQDRMIAVERIRDAFLNAIFTAHDIEAALALVTPDCTFSNLPAGMTVTGAAAVREHLERDVLPHLPDDLAFRRISRTNDRWRVAQEDVVTFTHDRELPWLLPGVAPTGRAVEVLAISITTVQGSVVKSHRALWDHLALTAGASRFHQVRTPA